MEATQDPGSATGRSWTRPRLRTLLFLGVGISVLVLLYGYWVGWAGSVQDPKADAVVVHAGQRHRIRHADQLMADGAAPTLVILSGADYYGGDETVRCQQTEPYEVVCPVPDTATTLGEAREIDALAEEFGWDSVIAVTTNYHLRRATYLDRKCSDIEILGVAAKPKTLGIRLQGVISEMVAMPVAIFSSC